MLFNREEKILGDVKNSDTECNGEQCQFGDVAPAQQSASDIDQDPKKNKVESDHSDPNLCILIQKCFLLTIIHSDFRG